MDFKNDTNTLEKTAEEGSTSKYMGKKTKSKFRQRKEGGIHRTTVDYTHEQKVEIEMLAAYLNISQQAVVKFATHQLFIQHAQAIRAEKKA